jgi:hypothetical protein
MMLTWFFAGLCLHHAMTNPASKVIFWGPDEDRALQPLDYAWTLWENQVQQLKEAWPLDRPRERQGYMRLELANDSALVALPGKDPDRIRKDHPTIVLFDETARKITAVSPTAAPATGGHHFFSPVSQFSTTVNGARACPACCAGARKRKRLPSNVYSPSVVAGC